MPRAERRTLSNGFLAKAVGAPGGPGRLGVRVVRSTQGFRREALLHIDPSDYRCSRLAAQLADEWVEYVAATGIGQWSGTYRRAVHELCTAVDGALGPDAAGVALASPELARVLARWERRLPECFAVGSAWPAYLAGAVHVLITRREEHPDRPVDPALARLAKGPLLVAKGESSERDEFTRAEKRAMVRAAWHQVGMVQQRLAAGWALAGQGRDPRQGGWTDVPDLLWGLSRGVVGPGEICAALAPVDEWPRPLSALAARPDASVHARTARYRLCCRLVEQLYPTTMDLHGLRVLLMDATGHAAEEVTGFGEDQVEFLPKGVRLTLVKNRAGLLRHRAFRDAAPYADPGARELVAADQPRREASAVVRRLLHVTEQVRARAPELTDSLFVRAAVRRDYRLVFEYWNPGSRGHTFGSWLDQGGLEVGGARHIGRLRKSTKVEKGLATGGRISEAADDHRPETFAGHYAQGTTLRIVSGEVITTAQEHWFGQAVDGPTVLTAGAAQDTAALQALGLERHEAEDMVKGQLDMGISHCRDPWQSPYSPAGQLCAVAPLRCLECRNAWVLPSQLPQLLLFERHLERLRTHLSPQAFTRLWGRSYANLRAVLAERSEQDMVLARKHIEAGRLELPLPLSAQAEFDA
jgi:hypothetical protein